MNEAGAALQGFFMGASLIIAIGAQNAFVLTQAVKGRHALAVAALCAALDVLLIAAGVLGLGTMVAGNRSLQALTSLGGAAYLIWFGCRSLFEAFKPQSLAASETCAETSADKRRASLGAALGATLAVSLLNPHVYLDTVIMLGSISGSFAGPGRYAFGLGAAAASICWFFSLSLAGRLLAPLFLKPRAWQCLHLAVCLMVWWVAFGLLRAFFTE